MDDDASNGSFSHMEIEETIPTELKYEQGGVSQKFTINGNRRAKEILIPGKLLITENKYSEYIEWKPNEEQINLRSASSHEWPGIHGANGGIGYKASNGVEEIEFLPEEGNLEFRRPIKIELMEIKSFVISPPNKSEKRELIIILSEGTTQNPFVFEHGSPENLIHALERSLTITKGKQKNLYIASPKRDVPKTTTMDFMPTPQNINNWIGGFVNDPVTTVISTLANVKKIADNVANGEYGELSPMFTSKPSTPNPPSREDSNYGSRRVTPDPVLAKSSDSVENFAESVKNEEGYEVVWAPDKPRAELGQRPKTYRGQPLSQEQWLNYLDNEGRITNFDEILKIVFHGGVEGELRKHVWGFLVGLYDPSSTHEQRRSILAEKSCSYERMKIQWATISEDQEERFHPFRDFKSLIDKDVSRTDRTLDFFKGENNQWTEVLRNILMTYVMYNFNLGYVQGMSDILSPILMEIQDEVLAFWIFVKYMDRIDTNFEMSQEGMQRQLKESYILLQLVDPKFSAYLDACDASNMFFAFRWLLILFKREFATQDILTLWETLWTNVAGKSFHLFIALAILEKQRSLIMESKFGLSEILRNINDLTMKINLEETLCTAEGIYLQVMNSEESLPNNIRNILGLPDIEQVESRRSTPIDAGNEGGQGDVPTSSRSVPQNALFNNEEHIETLCDLGITQFL